MNLISFRINTAANAIANIKVTIVTNTIKNSVFWNDFINFSSLNNIIKLFNPTNFLLFVSPPHLNNYIQNTFKVGIIINKKNKINYVITDKDINSFLDLLFFFK